MEASGKGAPMHKINDLPDDRRSGFRLSIQGALNATLSLTFLVLAAYIGWYSTTVSGPDSTELRYFAALVGAYGIWRTARSVIRSRNQDS